MPWLAHRALRLDESRSRPKSASYHGCDSISNMAIPHKNEGPVHITRALFW